MNTLASRVLPSVTNMIRMDHTHVLSTFHQYKPSASERVRKGLAETICLGLEVHAQLEEEIFYPAVREVAADLVGDSLTEHQTMRSTIARLRGMEPTHAEYDDTVYSLMRLVMHHVADEETIVLPAAERLMPESLGDLGLRMTRRRMQLVAPRAGEIATNMGRAASGNKVALMLLGAAGLGLLLTRRNGNGRDRS
jgi:hemerythrin superfamily protein